MTLREFAAIQEKRKRAIEAHRKALTFKDTQRQNRTAQRPREATTEALRAEVGK